MEVTGGKIHDDLTDLENQLNNIGAGSNERNGNLGQERTGERGKLAQSQEKSEEQPQSTQKKKKKKAKVQF